MPGGFGERGSDGKILAINYARLNKIPFLGICLGMQLMGSKGQEGGICEGLNILPFEVKPFDISELRNPHIGWNNVKKNADSKLLHNVPDQSDFYFVHSYHLDQIEKKYITGVCDYGIEFPAVIEYKNIFGTQFHPEKSQKYGLQIIENFIKISSS